MAQLVEHILGKDEVPGPNPGSSSKRKGHLSRCPFLAFGQLPPIRTGSASPSGEAEYGPHTPTAEHVELARKWQGVGIFTEMQSDTVAHLCEYPGTQTQRTSIWMSFFGCYLRYIAVP